MPKVNVSVPFHFRDGLGVKRFEKGEQEVSEAVAAHARAHEFLRPEPKPAPEKAAAKGGGSQPAQEG